MGRVTTVINSAHGQTQLSPVAFAPFGLSDLIQLGQCLRLLRVAIDLPVAQVPALLTAAPAQADNKKTVDTATAIAVLLNARTLRIFAPKIYDMLLL